MRSQLGVQVRASPRSVFELVRDIASWPKLLPHYRKVTIHSRDTGHVVATMAANRFVGPIGLPVSWRAEQWADDSDPLDLRLRFVHLGGWTRGMDVTWNIRPRGDGASVTIEHVFSRPLPILGWELLPRVVDRLFVKPIAGRTLATFKALAERE